jgi:methylmalonyl-CoA carboxyltransferase 12S subunit
MGFLLLPLGIFAGWVAGAAMSRRLMRRELNSEVKLVIARTMAKYRYPTPPPVAAKLPEPPKAVTEQVEEVSPETILILSAAVAAYLGKRAHIRSARLVRTAPSSAWAQQGRVFTQASNNLGVVHGR